MNDIYIYDDLDDWVDLDEEGIYSEEGREFLVENDEITPEEAAFMNGWEAADENYTKQKTKRSAED